MTRCEYGGCRQIADYKLTAKEHNLVRFCCTLHIGNIIESNHLSNTECLIIRLNTNKIMNKPYTRV